MKNKKDYLYYKKQKRDWFEGFVDMHNHKLELLRTLGSMLGVILQVLVLLKVFGKI